MLTYVSVMTQDHLLSPTSRLFLQHGLCSLLCKSFLFFWGNKQHVAAWKLVLYFTFGVFFFLTGFFFFYNTQK